MPNTKTLPVPHLDGITAAYQSPQPYDPCKPTIVLINAFTTSSELYRDQFANKQLTDLVNLLAIEVLGHGQTRTKREHWTFWDSAEMNLQVLDELKIERAFVLGTSQGGWVAMRMALMRPEKVAGVITLGSSMDYESSISRQLHCWDAPTLLSPAISQLSTSHPTPDFLPDPDYCDFLVDTGFGKDNCPAEVREFWRNNIRENYMGDDGRRRIWMAAVNLRDRDGLHSRLGDIRCPVLWLHGTNDAAYSIANAEREIKLFVNSPDASLVPIEGGAHFLGATHPREVDAEIVKFVTKYSFIPKYSKIER